MEKLFTISGLVVVILLSLSCGSSSNQQQHPATTNMQGTWIITATQSDGSSVVFTATLFSVSSCSVGTPLGTFTVQGPTCFFASDSSRQGSLSTTGTWVFSAAGILIGVPSNPASIGSSMSLLFAEDRQSGPVAVFEGVGTVNGDTLTGTWSCNVDSPYCLGLSGTFSGTQQ